MSSKSSARNVCSNNPALFFCVISRVIEWFNVSQLMCEIQEREGSENGVPSTEEIHEDNRSWFLAANRNGRAVKAWFLSNVCKLPILVCWLSCDYFFDANVILDLYFINCYPMYGFRQGHNRFKIVQRIKLEPFVSFTVSLFAGNNWKRVSKQQLLKGR